jgi:acetyl-CoA carboxylase beta subunit
MSMNQPDSRSLDMVGVLGSNPGVPTNPNSNLSKNSNSSPTSSGQQVASKCDPCHVAHRSSYDLRRAAYVCCMCRQHVTERDRTYIWGVG